MKRSFASLVLLMTLFAAACSATEPAETSDPPPTTAGGGLPDATTTTSVPPSPTTPATPTTPPPPDRAPECAGDDWLAFGVGPFGFWAPASVIDQNPQGIDSLVGRYVGAGLEIVFDYGWYSPGIDDLERLGATIATIELGDVTGRFATASGAAAEYGSEFLTHLRVDEIPGVDPANALWLGVNYDDAALTPTAECVVSTVRFT